MASQLPSPEELASAQRDFFSALDGGNAAALRAILAKYKDAGTWVDEDDKTGLMRLAVSGDIALATILIFSGGAQADAENGKKSTALMFAGLADQKAMVEFLLGADAEIDHQNINLTTTLMAAAAAGNQSLVELLVEKYGADTELRDKNGLTAEKLAANNGKKATASYLAKMTKKIAAVREDYFEAIEKNDLRKLGSILAQHKFAVRWKNENGQTGLMRAALSGNTAIAAALLDAGAKPDAENPKGSTALMFAAQAGHADMADLLIARGAKVDRQNKKLSTALMAAAAAGHLELVKLLVNKYNADVTLADDAGLTAEKHAAKNGYNGVAFFLAGVSKPAVPPPATTPATPPAPPPAPKSTEAPSLAEALVPDKSALDAQMREFREFLKKSNL